MITGILSKRRCGYGQISSDNRKMKSLNNNNQQQEPFSLSIVMPVYNEGDIIEKVVRNFCDRVLSRFKKKEFVLVDDHSTDSTGAILKKLRHEYPYIRILTNSFNQGHGPSLVRAYREAKGDYVFHCDSDNQFIAEDFWLIWKKLKESKSELVMGYRRERNDPLYRTIMSNVLRIFNFILFGVLYHDINAPFKLYKKSSLKRILPIVPQDAFVPTILMVISAYICNVRISEVAVRHLPRLTGKSFIGNWRIIAFCWKAGREIIQFKRRLSKSSQKDL